MTVGQLEQLITPATPIALVLFVVLGVGVWWVCRRLARSIGRVGAGAASAEERLAASIARIGERVGELEAESRLERVRRFQLESTLRSRGIALPPWPDDPWPDDNRTDYREDNRDDYPDDFTAEAPRVPVPPLPDLPGLARHRR